MALPRNYRCFSYLVAFNVIATTLGDSSCPSLRNNLEILEQLSRGAEEAVIVSDLGWTDTAGKLSLLLSSLSVPVLSLEFPERTRTFDSPVLSFTATPFMRSKRILFFLLLSASSHQVFFEHITDAGLMDYEWQFLIITEQDTRENIQPFLVESTRVAMLLILQNCMNDIGNTSNSTESAASWLSDIFLSQVDQTGQINLLEVQSKQCTSRTDFNGQKCSSSLKKVLFPDLTMQYSDLQGRKFKVGSFANNPAILPGLWNYDNPDAAKGVEGNLLIMMADAMNFTFEIVQPADGQWGVDQGNGVWSGLVGQVQRREVDFAINDVTITSARGVVVDMGNPYFVDAIHFFSKAPGVQVPFNSLLKPFTWPVWLAVFIFLLISICVHKLLAVAGIKFEHHVIEAYRTLIQQSGMREPVNQKARLFMAVWLLYCLLLISHYRGVYYTHLALPAQETPIDDVEEVLKRVQAGKVKVGAVAGTFTEELLLGPGPGTFGEISKYKDSSWNARTGLVEYLELAGSDASWTSYWSREGSRVAMTELGDWKFHISAKGYFPNCLGMMMQKGSPLTPKFNRIISYVWSGGFVNHWFEERLFLSRLQTHSLRPANNRLVVLTMQHLGLGFVILGGGLLCATIAFIGEVVTRCFKKEEVRVLTE